MDISELAEIGTAIGTLALALGTYSILKETQIQGKRDRIAKEMDLLILPLKAIYQEIDSHEIDGNWWELYFGPMRNKTDPVAAQRFRDAVNSVDQYRYLAPEKLRLLIDEFLPILKDMKRGKDSANFGDFQRSLIDATTNLYYKGDVKGGSVELRYYDLTRETDLLNKDSIDKIYSLIQLIWQRLREKPR